MVQMHLVMSVEELELIKPMCILNVQKLWMFVKRVIEVMPKVHAKYEKYNC